MEYILATFFCSVEQKRVAVVYVSHQGLIHEEQKKCMDQLPVCLPINPEQEKKHKKAHVKSIFSMSSRMERH